MEHLVQQNLTHPTLRRHLNALWVIGGETIRMLQLDPAMRSEPPLDLLQATIAGGEGPWVDDLTDAEQAALDATARKLQRFLGQIADLRRPSGQKTP